MIRSLVGGGAIGLVATALVAAASLSPAGSMLQELELDTWDARLALTRDPAAASDDVLVLAIDDATIRSLEVDDGISWPFPRFVYGEIVQALATLEPRAIVFDFIFSEQRDGARYGAHGDPFTLSAESEDGRRDVQYSRGAAMQMNAAGNTVIGVHAVHLRGAEEGIRNATGWNEALVPHLERRIPPAAGRAPPRLPGRDGWELALRFPEANMLVGARALGLVNHEHLTDLDGVSRRSQPVVEIGGRPVPELAATALLVSSQPRTVVAWTHERPPAADEWPALPPIALARGSVTIAGRRMPVDDRGNLYLRWRGNWSADPALTGRTRSLRELWAARDALLLGEPASIDEGAYRGKIVVVGFTGQGEASDFVATPFGPQPGVYRHVTALDTMLAGDFLEPLSAGAGWSIALAFAVLTGAVILARARASAQVSGSIAADISRLLAVGVLPGAAFLLLALLAFRTGVVVPVVPAASAMALTTLAVVVVGIVWAQAEERRARKIAVRALGPALVKQVLASGGELTMGGTRVPLTLFFSDIAGFTTLSEKLPPEELVHVLNEYLTRVSEILHDRHGATIDKYIGDAVMAFWGAPLPDPDGPVRACLAALDVRDAVETYSAELAAKGHGALRTRIGLNTGPAVAGGVGHIRDAEDGKFSYTAMGDTVNLASRLEGANKAYGTTIMIGPETFDRAKQVIFARELDLVIVKGKTQPVRVYELIGRASDALPEKRRLAARYEAALARFRARDFAIAREEFLALEKEFGDPASRTMAASCEEKRQVPPPPDWDGSNELHEK